MQMNLPTTLEINYHKLNVSIVTNREVIPENDHFRSKSFGAHCKENCFL